MIHFPNFDAYSKTSDKFYSASPYHFDNTASMGKYIKGMLTYDEIILAEVVFPVPGGPSNRIALGRLL